MFQALGSIKGLLKVDGVCIDNNIFKLHYKATVAILMLFALIVTSKQYFGDPIECMHKDLKQDAMDIYCWTYATFTVVKNKREKVGQHVIAPRVGPYNPAEGDKRKFHEYYQWVCIVLFFQAMSFYAPRYLWKAWEGGRLKVLVLNLDCPVVSEADKNERKKLLTDYFVSRLNNHNLYAVRFFICEVLNFVNVIAQFCLTDLFLKGDFFSYGLDVLRHTETDPDVKDNPMDLAFPKVTKCRFFDFGSTGDPQPYDILCLLPLNVVNEKLYLVLWYWFVILMVLTGLALLFQTAVIICPLVRINVLRARTRFSRQDHIKFLTKKCSFGDWFLLDQLARNIDNIIYREILADLARKLKEEDGLRMLNKKSRGR